MQCYTFEPCLETLADRYGVAESDYHDTFTYNHIPPHLRDRRTLEQRVAALERQNKVLAAELIALKRGSQ